MFHRIRSSLVSKIKAISIIGTVLTCILVFIITWHILYRLQLQNAYEIAQRDLKMTSYYIDTVIKKMVGVTDSLVFEEDVYKLLTGYYQNDIVKHARLKSDVKSKILLPLSITEEYRMEIFLADRSGNIYTTYSYNYASSDSGKKEAEEMVNRYLTDYDYTIPRLYMRETVRDVFDSPMLTFVRPMYYRGTSVLYGHVLVFIDSRVITDLFQDSWYEDNYQVAVLNDDNSVIIHTDPDQIGEVWSDSDIRDDSSNRRGKIDLSKEYDWLLSEKKPTDRYRIAFGINGRKIYRTVISNILILAFFILLVLLSTMFAQILIEERATKSLKLLAHKIRKIGKGNYGQQIEVRGSDEIAEVAVSVNQMSSKIQDQIAQIVGQEQENSKLTILIYQARLNPHFIFNTLNDIKWMAFLGEKEKVMDAVSALGMILEQSIRRTDGMVTVEEEISLLKAYIEIENMRYQGKFTVDFSVEEGTEILYLPTLLLQPMVENAIFYGVGRKTVIQIEITIKLRKEEDVPDGKKQLELIVADNGPGMTEEQIGKIEGADTRSAAHLGIQTSRKRIELMFGSGYGLAITSRPGEGTAVRIRIPAVYEWKKEEKTDEKTDDRG